ncbi:alcohol dehydrogenase catalytic domain-containing protein [Staphylococcus capitis]|uniref:alcohol dehydrogenase catalytic domain-containing protein n=1 Tax=Staphylococcus capitis TaxID=29388 RepID=UPI0021B3BF9B|nr:alcohol dehydrogenase catalytic domain-containing protein [Staphylococcus capitis]
MNVEDGNQFEEIEFNIGNGSRNELLIKVESISVNGVDRKEGMLAVNHVLGILGFDVGGIVEEVGEDVRMFEGGEYVFY